MRQVVMTKNFRWDLLMKAVGCQSENISAQLDAVSQWNKKFGLTRPRKESNLQCG